MNKIELLFINLIDIKINCRLDNGVGDEIGDINKWNYFKEDGWLINLLLYLF